MLYGRLKIRVAGLRPGGSCQRNQPVAWSIVTSPPAFLRGCLCKVALMILSSSLTMRAVEPALIRASGTVAAGRVQATEFILASSKLAIFRSLGIIVTALLGHQGVIRIRRALLTTYCVTLA
jgi:hypothetical protein